MPLSYLAVPKTDDFEAASRSSTPLTNVSKLTPVECSLHALAHFVGNFRFDAKPSFPCGRPLVQKHA